MTYRSIDTEEVNSITFAHLTNYLVAHGWLFRSEGGLHIFYKDKMEIAISDDPEISDIGARAYFFEFLGEAV